METCRREFLQKISGGVVLAASRSILSWNGGGALNESSPPVGGQAARDLKDLRAQFPVLEERVNGRSLVYLDNAATTQRPRAVIDRLGNFYLHDNANPAMNVHTPRTAIRSPV
jgi:hypothetical protein